MTNRQKNAKCQNIHPEATADRWMGKGTGRRGSEAPPAKTHNTKGDTMKEHACILIAMMAGAAIGFIFAIFTASLKMREREHQAYRQGLADGTAPTRVNPVNTVRP